MFLLDLLYPKKCVSCKTKGVYLCPECLAQTKTCESFCVVCGKSSIDFMTHFACTKKLSVSACIALFEYDGVIKDALHTIKYSFATDVISELSSFCVAELSEMCFLPTRASVIPIPLSKKRENWRGFNQAELLAYKIATAFPEWLIETNMLIRKYHKQNQADLTKEKRKKNIQGVFSFNSKYKGEIPKTVIVFDDVYTTGATIKEAGKVLKRKGVEKVWGLSIAH